MSKNNKKSHSVAKKFRTILIACVIIYLFFQILPALHATSLKTYIVESGGLEIIEEVQGIVFKDEKVYKSTATGPITFCIQEGDRVGVGNKIAEIPINSNTSKLEKELQSIEKQIENLSNSNMSVEFFQSDIEKNQQYIDDIMKKIGDSIINRDYKKVAELRVQLNEKLDKQKSLTGQKGYNAHQLNNLKDRKEEIVTEMKALNVEFNAEISGIVSYSIDGLEMVYTPIKLTDFYPDNFKILEEHYINIYEQESIKADQPMYKIIDNYEWYVAGMITNKEVLRALTDKTHIYIRIDDVEHELKAEIFKINNRDDSGVLILRLNKHMHEFYKKRFVNLKIVLDKFEGLKIPAEAIVSNNGMNGVYIKGIGGITKFRAIEILGQDGEFTIVKDLSDTSKTSLRANTGVETKKIYYLSTYDEIIIDGDKVTEGEIIN